MTPNHMIRLVNQKGVISYDSFLTKYVIRVVRKHHPQFDNPANYVRTIHRVTQIWLFKLATNHAATSIALNSFQ